MSKTSKYLLGKKAYWTISMLSPYSELIRKAAPKIIKDKSLILEKPHSRRARQNKVRCYMCQLIGFQQIGDTRHTYGLSGRQHKNQYCPH